MQANKKQEIRDPKLKQSPRDQVTGLLGDLGMEGGTQTDVVLLPTSSDRTNYKCVTVTKLCPDMER